MGDGVRVSLLAVVLAVAVACAATPHAQGSPASPAPLRALLVLDDLHIPFRTSLDTALTWLPR